MSFWSALKTYISNLFSREYQVTIYDLMDMLPFVETYLGISTEGIPFPQIQRSSKLLEKWGPPDAMAAYVPGSIIIHDFFTRQDLPWVCHELVHHYQLMKQCRYPWPNARERPAYMAQNLYAEFKGFRLRVSQSFIDEISGIREPIHRVL